MKPMLNFLGGRQRYDLFEYVLLLAFVMLASAAFIIDWQQRLRHPEPVKPPAAAAKTAAN